MTRNPIVLAACCFAAALTLAACDATSPTGLDGDDANAIVVTQGVPAPAPLAPPALSDLATSSNLGGSAADAISLKPSGCDGSSQVVVVTFTITGRQDNPASYKVNTNWSYDGSTWAGSAPTTVSVPARAAGDPATIRPVNVTVANGSATSSGTSSFVIQPFDVVTTAPAALSVTVGNVTIHVAFNACPVTNTPPTLVLPSDFEVEATSANGAAVSFAAAVTATDLEDGDLSSEVECTPASGSTFPLGETTVNCSVTDSGGLSDEGSFKITVVDTTPPEFTSIPTGTLTRIAQNSNGWSFDLSSFDAITAEDVGHVSEPVDVDCTPADGTTLAIGSTTPVVCTATDQSDNAKQATFNVFVGLNVSASGFLSPLRMAAPYSSHRLNSTIPHKFYPPTYADGSPATDLASGLTLTVTKCDPNPDQGIEGNDYSAGDTAWRYDAAAGQYVFNLKTSTGSPWSAGTWKTTVAYAGITLAETRFELRR